MIIARSTRQGIVLDVELPEGASAYVDADWIPASGRGAVPAIVIGPGGSWLWTEGYARPLITSHGDRDNLAAALLAATAEEAVAVVGTAAPGRCEVMGTGATADRVRRLLEADGRDQPSGERPTAAIDVTGEPQEIICATERLQNLGVLVLAGFGAASFPLNLYPDVFTRGLRVQGVGFDHETSLAPDREAHPTPIVIGRPLPSGPPSGWFRLEDSALASSSGHLAV